VFTRVGRMSGEGKRAGHGGQRRADELEHENLPN
jgi:hypothetical protein